MQENRFPLVNWQSLPMKPVAVDDQRCRVRETVKARVKATVQAFIEAGHPISISAEEAAALLDEHITQGFIKLIKRLVAVHAQ
jgi:hypothetical protein